MKEFMLLIRTEGDPWTVLSPEQLQHHMQKGVAYITGLMNKGIIKSAQPFENEGGIISGNGKSFTDGPFNESKEVIAGYFHIVAKDIEEAKAIARANPIFEDGLNARIEVRPVKGI